MASKYISLILSHVCSIVPPPFFYLFEAVLFIMLPDNTTSLKTTFVFCETTWIAAGPRQPRDARDALHQGGNFFLCLTE